MESSRQLYTREGEWVGLEDKLLNRIGSATVHERGRLGRLIER